MNNSKLIQLIRESINEYINEIDEAGNIAMYEMKIAKIGEAIELREKKIAMEGIDEAYHDMIDKSKMKELSGEVKTLKKSLAKYEKQLEKLKNKGEKVTKVEDTEEKEIVDEVAIDENEGMGYEGMGYEGMGYEGMKENESDEMYYVDVIKANTMDEETAYNWLLSQGADNIDNIIDIAFPTMNESFLHMQKLAGVITEAQYKAKRKALNENEVGGDNNKALGILFHPNDDMEEADETPYIWDRNAYENLVKDMGYEDYEDVAGEMTHYFSPGDNDEMRVMRNLIGNPNLQPTDLTIGMYKKAIRREYPD
jgi:hypothetical protein